MSTPNDAAANALRTAILQAIANAEAYAAKLSDSLVTMGTDEKSLRDELAGIPCSPGGLMAQLARHTEVTLLALCETRLAYRQYLSQVNGVIQDQRALLEKLSTEAN